MQFDHELGIRQMAQKVARTQDTRHRRMLEVVLDHMVAENEGDIDRIMASISPRASYHVWSTPDDIGCKGYDGVRQYYEGFFALKGHFFENDIQRIAVDDDCVVTEAVMRMIKPGSILAGDAYGPGTGPMDPGELGAWDPSAHYLFENRVVIIWPFDENLMLIGEDAYSGGARAARQLSDDELPPAYLKLMGLPV
jgi:hypothetical protein